MVTLAAPDFYVGHHGIMGTILTFIFDNKEWLFSGIGIFVIAGIFSILRKKPKSRSKTIMAIDKQVKIIEKLPDKKSSKTSDSEPHIIKYISNIPLDPNITSDELNILKNFCEFPRGHHTQGYRLDWIYNELLSKIPASTLHPYLENLFLKGYLARYISGRGSIYYRISSNGISYLVDNELIKIEKAQPQFAPDR